ncbi:MAG: hypothetical protein ACLU9S_10005 [Oscillospiraceae bacterium]
MFPGPLVRAGRRRPTGLLRDGVTRQDHPGAGGRQCSAPFLSALLYQKTRKLWLAYAGEWYSGTGILSAIAVYPLMRLFYGLPSLSFYYIPSMFPPLPWAAGWAAPSFSFSGTPAL